MNRLNLVFSGLMFLVSLFHAVSSALKYGTTWEVQTIIDGVVRTSTQNTFLNIIISGLFGFMLITSAFSIFFLGELKEKGQ